MFLTMASKLEARVTSRNAGLSTISSRVLGPKVSIPRRRAVIFAFILIAISAGVPAADAQWVQLSVDVSKAGAKIDRNIFGQFAEHLGHGV
jgi:hypothetical protein